MKRSENTKLIAGVVVLAALALVLGVWPNVKGLERLGETRADLVSRVERSDDGDAALERLAGELGEHKLDARVRLRPIPEDGDVGGLIRAMSDEFAQLGLGRPEIKTGRPIEHDDAMALPMTVEIRGTFLNIADVIQWVESLDRLVRVRKVRIESPRSGTAESDFSEVLEAELVLDVFYAPRFESPLEPAAGGE